MFEGFNVTIENPPPKNDKFCLHYRIFVYVIEEKRIISIGSYMNSDLHY
jgi:hypothetical protein